MTETAVATPAPAGMAGSEGSHDYNYHVVRQFAVMTVVWGIVGMLVGVILAAQLIWPQLNFDVPYLSYGRLRPLHTNAVIFALATPHCLARTGTLLFVRLTISAIEKTS